MHGRTYRQKGRQTHRQRVTDRVANTRADKQEHGHRLLEPRKSQRWAERRQIHYIVDRNASTQHSEIQHTKGTEHGNTPHTNKTFHNEAVQRRPHPKRSRHRTPPPTTTTKPSSNRMFGRQLPYLYHLHTRWCEGWGWGQLQTALNNNLAGVGG